ncbi:hypothetical protein Q75_10890 [Bacillus coahuilensis p1.1.43]|uniref:Uncharacterized protein n=1 Tax=Bacillus coahuilensis p1.1.43 TaxID=1150625 RepID=A0A147K7B0_9BACI|nr:hypothetical protein Q75_10890 [Bacillus coahuilensis p1.1.43]
MIHQEKNRKIEKKGVNAVNLLLIVVAFLLLLPILYFLPIGFQLKGKIILASVALFISLLGMIASISYPVGAVLIVLFILVLFSTYILEKRFSPAFSGLTSADEGEESNMDEFEEQVIPRVTPEKTNNVSAISHLQDEEPSLQHPKSDVKESKELPFVESSKTDVSTDNKNSDEYLEDEELEEIFAAILEEPLEEEPLPNDEDSLPGKVDEEELDSVLPLLVDENTPPQDEEELELEEIFDQTDRLSHSEETESTKIDELQEDSPVDYLEDLFQEELDTEEEDKELSYDSNKEDSTPVLHEEDSLTDQDLFEIDESSVDSEETPNLNQDTESEPNQNENESKESHSISAIEEFELQSPESIEEETTLEQDEVLLEETQETAESFDESDEVEQEELEQQDHVVEIETTEKKSISHLIVQTFVKQLLEEKQQLEAPEYQHLIKQYLHPNLHDKDYYVFAKMLVESYIENEDQESLAELIVELEKRFESYPVVQQEIQLFKLAK